MLNLGATKVELGVQCLNDGVLESIRRGHGVRDVEESTARLRDTGFKIGYHIMPGLPGASHKVDVESARRVFEDQAFCPDYLKIYPTLVVEGSPLQPLNLRLRIDKGGFDAMGRDEEYVAYDAPLWAADVVPLQVLAAFPKRQYTEVRFGGSPLVVNVYDALPETDFWGVEFDAGFALGIFDLGIEYDTFSYDIAFGDSMAAGLGFDEWDGDVSRFAGRARAKGSPMPSASRPMYLASSAMTVRASSRSGRGSFMRGFPSPAAGSAPGRRGAPGACMRVCAGIMLAPGFPVK